MRLILGQLSREWFAQIVSLGVLKKGDFKNTIRLSKVKKCVVM